MKLLNRLTGWLLFLAVVAIGGGIAQAAFRGEHVWSLWIEIAETHRLIIGGGGAALVALALLRLLTALPPRRNRRFLAFENPGGEVLVSLEAIRDYLLRMNTDFPSVVKLHPQVQSVREELVVTIGCEVRSGCVIPDLSQQIQERVRERIVTGIGISAIRTIRVVVRQIVDAGRSSVTPRRESPEAPEPVSRATGDETPERGSEEDDHDPESPPSLHTP